MCVFIAKWTLYTTFCLQKHQSFLVSMLETRPKLLIVNRGSMQFYMM